MQLLNRLYDRAERAVPVKSGLRVRWAVYASYHVEADSC